MEHRKLAVNLLRARLHVFALKNIMRVFIAGSSVQVANMHIHVPHIFLLYSHIIAMYS